VILLERHICMSGIPRALKRALPVILLERHICAVRHTKGFKEGFAGDLA